ncbi:PAS domain-containing sensor histidine kinase [Chelativorans sp. ZYF759]|uniref:sensor histidine kinase n=1 Tax=Chelativorans sp. ZYF759 TaxID=2692213 RepID=UPI00145DF6E8|nr:PAS domain-containing sensor histidine kinase [Chelativorans sp. ZYF759]NMG38970.1 PAS domain-containing sensor histidine kinase [Chelativorans sp. ZYF759]
MILGTEIREEFRQAVEAGCDLLVSPSGLAARDQERQRRLVASLLAAPFILSGAWIASSAGDGVMHLLAGILVIFAGSFSLVLMLAATGRAVETAKLSLGLATLATAWIIAAGGGLMSPMAALSVALPIEAYRVARDRKAMHWGLAALAGVVLLQLPFGALAGPVAAVSGWHWLAPALYGALLFVRPMQGEGEVRSAAQNIDHILLERMGGAVLWIGPDGHITQATPRTEEVLGLAPELVVEGGLFDRIRIPDRVAYRCALADVQTGVARRSVELMLRVPGDDEGEPAVTHRPFEMELIRSPQEDGSVIAILRSAEATAQLREELARARDIAGSTELAKGRFLATVSHELRTPLNAIIGFSDLMLHESISGPLDPKKKEHLGLIRDAGRHLLSVVNSILDLSKIEAGTYRLQPERFQFATAASLGSALLEPQAVAKQLKLTTRISDLVGEVNCDQRAVQQILINLLSNAIKFTPEGGAVTLEAHLDRGRLVMRVSDTGIGMSEEELAGIGQPFTQVSNAYTRQYEGTGLGLCLVKGLVELHGGAMTIESAPGLGTAVTVTLPQIAIQEEADDREAGIGSGKEGETQDAEEEHEAILRIA